MHVSCNVEDYMETGEKRKGRQAKVKAESLEEDSPPIDAIQDPPKAKRGRKKKEKVEEEVKVKKKRGRKAALKFYSSSIRKKIPIKTDLQNSENVILHLEITEPSSQHQKESESFLQNDDQPSLVVGDDEHDILEEYLNEIDKDPELTLKSLYDDKIEQRKRQDSDILDKLQDCEEDTTLLNNLLSNLTLEQPTRSMEQPASTTSDRQNKHKKKGYMIMFQDMIENGKWIKKDKEVKCWWCCHEVDDTPLGLPLKYNVSKKKYLVKGYFCSTACTLAWWKTSKYARDSNIMHLIKMLYRGITGSSIMDPVEPAPPRETLKMFGGDLDIEEFRRATTNKKAYKLLDYPLMVVKEYIEEIDLNILKERNKSISVAEPKNMTLQDDQIKEAKSRLSRIERPAVDNTIDKFLNIR
jgi:hypothetical protein